MSQEIIEHIRGLEREKGIEENTVIHALEDALLAAYKKTPGAAPPRRRRASTKRSSASLPIDIPEDLEWRPRRGDGGQDRTNLGAETEETGEKRTP